MKKHYPLPLAIAATLTVVGCMSVQPGNVTKVVDSSINAATTASGLTKLKIRFLPSNYKTQVAGTYRTEIRLMYTEAVVRNDGHDYHIGVKQGAVAPGTLGLAGLTLTDAGAAALRPGTESISGTIVPNTYAAAPGVDDPLFQQLAAAATATGSSVLADVASDSHQTGSYFLGAGIYQSTPSVPAGAPDDLLWYDVTNNPIATGDGNIATFSARTASEMLRVRPAIESIDSVLKNIFAGTQVTTYLTPTTYKTTNYSPSITAGTTPPYIQAVPVTLTTGKTLYYKVVLPAAGSAVAGNVKEVVFPALPLGRVVVDVRKYSSAGVVSSYSYGYFMLAPTGNTLAVGDIGGKITTDSTSSITL